MTSAAFDGRTRTGRSRPATRHVALALAAVLVVLTWRAAAPEPPEAGWLFTQTAEAGRLERYDDGAYLLVLRGVDRHMIAFTDRPGREASVIGTGVFIAAWGRTFATSGPNAALVEHEPDGTTDTLVVTLSDPAYDPGTGELRYRAVVLADELHPERLSGLGGERHEAAPAAFGAASLFIDSAAEPSTSTCKLGPAGSCAGLYYRNANLSGLDLSEIDLSGADLAGVQFVGTDLTNANLASANLTGAVFTDARLGGTILAGANLSKANFAGTDLRNVGGFGSAILTGADFSKANFAGRQFADTDLLFAGADLAAADFTGADFSNTKTWNFSFASAKLAGADFSGSDHGNGSFRGADLRGAKFDGARLYSASRPGAVFVPGWDTKDCGYTDPIDPLCTYTIDFRDADLTGARFTSAFLNGARLEGARVSDIDLTYAVLARVIFDGIVDDLGSALLFTRGACQVQLPGGAWFGENQCSQWLTETGNS
jgi:uncharacterized protein YjbI with pentapeptide repeats